MPVGVQFHERYALAFDRPGHDDLGFAPHGLGGIIRVQHLGQIMPIDLNGVPAEAAPLLGQRFDILDVFDRPVLLELVGVDDGADGLECVVVRG
mgnify:CR=1 FL=1